MLNIFIGLICGALIIFGIYKFRHQGKDDLAGNPLNPAQIAQRRENLDKIMVLASKTSQLTNDAVQRALGVSDATATRYLEYLVALGKLARVGERGQQVFYKLPQ